MTNPKKVTRRVFRGYAPSSRLLYWYGRGIYGPAILLSINRNSLISRLLYRDTDTHHVKITVETWEINGKGKR